MKRFGILILLFCLLVPLMADDPAEMRAFYAATFDVNTQAKCDTIISNTQANNINAVFVEVRGRADAYYYPNREDSTYTNTEPRGELYAISPSDLDVLQYFIDKLHNSTPKVEVHAWCTTFNSWNRSTAPVSSAHVYNAHPEWITADSSGTPYTYLNDAPLDPGIPAVQDYLYNVFMDIVRNYDVDGIQFDYIRLLGADSGYNSTALTNFANETGFTYTPATPGELSEVYEAWRRDQIAQLVQRVHSQTMLEKPWVDVSAFLVNFSDSVEVLGQGYNWWVAHDAIDVLHPGCYSSSVSGTEDDWDFYVAKLAANGDEDKIPMVAALGDYLLKDADENSTAVITLRGNSQVPDGFNFFDYGSLFIDGGTRTPPEPADQHAQNLFNPGGPMDDWADIPSAFLKSGEETTAPNAPASLSVSIVSDVPRVTFSRPSAAGDSDLPVHYRLYRDTDSSVDLYYDNMVMEWWDLSSSRSSFSFDDVEADAGTYYYSAVSYDDWNNSASSNTGPVTVTATDYIIETRTLSGKHVGDYSEESGTFFNSSSHSTASGCTPGIGSGFSLPNDAKDDKARFTPSALSTGKYDVYVTSFDYSSANAPGITVRVNDDSGVSTSLFDLTQANCGNKWAKVDTVDFTSGQGHYVEFDSATQTTSTSSDRMNAAAVSFVKVRTETDKESKPAVIEVPSTVTEVIADSSPQSLDYDDVGGTVGTTIWRSSSLSGYYNSNARYYSSSNDFPMENYAVWTVDLPRAGQWAIDGYVRDNTVFASGAKYRFTDESGTVHSVTTTQQTGTDNTTTGGWYVNVDGVNDSSAYLFDKGRVYVTLYGSDVASESVIGDALRFRYLGGVPVELSTFSVE
jgi:uncharacterized lipoprotein YddW (UPF0748 family)